MATSGFPLVDANLVHRIRCRNIRAGQLLGEKELGGCNIQ